MAERYDLSPSESSATWPKGGMNDGKRPPLPTSFRPDKRNRAALDEASPYRSVATRDAPPSSSTDDLPDLASWRSSTLSTDGASGDVNTGTYTRVHLKKSTLIGQR
ncbi:unnamed protein product [Peronospora destructor]|uniref:Uncharacterized protein n=1 Tax=Peronospora destructor TaxID=86335 RepID=A0AAV0T7H4_9STRA|nr:unnamed protein product [Peronospora destructor]